MTTIPLSDRIAAVRKKILAAEAFPDDPLLPALRAALETLEASEWRPIETAPKDGTEILTHDRGEFWIIWWSIERERWESEGLYFGDYLTHWRPLPEPPSSVK